MIERLSSLTTACLTINLQEVLHLEATNATNLCRGLPNLNCGETSTTCLRSSTKHSSAGTKAWSLTHSWILFILHYQCKLQGPTHGSYIEGPPQLYLVKSMGAKKPAPTWEWARQLQQWTGSACIQSQISSCILKGINTSMAFRSVSFNDLISGDKQS